MEWKKNDKIQVFIEDMGENGEGIGRTEGFTWFIKDAVIGDMVEATVMKRKPSYGFAKLKRILEPSPHRTVPRCPAARQCGGCQLQALEYGEQLKYKERKINDNLIRIGGFTDIPMLPIIGMDEPWRYRNKAQFPWGIDRDGQIIAGFYASRTHSIIPQEDCLLGVEENAAILALIKAFMERYHILPYDESTQKGFIRHTLIRKAFRTGELMVCQVINGDGLPHQEELVKSLLKVPGMTSICLNKNCQRTNVIMGNDIINLYGPGYITDYIGEVKYRISPMSFYQVNPIQTEKLYSTALEFAALSGNEIVCDLYCGIGTISLFLAQGAKKVYGVEIVSQAIDDAWENARLNGIENVEFVTGKVEEILPRLYEENKVRADVVVVDPPRKGCDEVCLDTIIKMGSKRVVYVSCDSATLARDLRYLTNGGYEVVRGVGLDLFPETVHVESVCLMTRTGKQ